MEDGLIEFRDLSLLVDEESSEGIEVITFEFEIEGLVEGIEGGSCGDGIGMVVEGADFIGFGVEFVLDVTDDFFEDVFHGDESGEATVFIDDDGHMDFILLEVFEDMLDLTGLGDIKGGRKDF